MNIYCHQWSYLTERDSSQVLPEEKSQVQYMVCQTRKGWIDRELFEEWFMQHLLTHIPPQRPVLLLLDGHSSHYHLSLICKAVENGLILFCLSRHTTHLAQPLDKSCFSPLKCAGNQECLLSLYVNSHPGQVINRFNFMEIYSPEPCRSNHQLSFSSNEIL